MSDSPKEGVEVRIGDNVWRRTDDGSWTADYIDYPIVMIPGGDVAQMLDRIAELERLSVLAAPVERGAGVLQQVIDAEREEMARLRKVIVKLGAELSEARSLLSRSEAAGSELNVAIVRFAQAAAVWLKGPDDGNSVVRFSAMRQSHDDWMEVSASVSRASRSVPASAEKGETP